MPRGDPRRGSRIRTGLEWVFSRSGVDWSDRSDGAAGRCSGQGGHPVEVGTVTIEWDGYEPYDPGVADPPNRLSRSEARQVFKRRMGAKSAHIEMLGRLLKANGNGIGTDERLQSRISTTGFWPASRLTLDSPAGSRPTGIRWHTTWRCSRRGDNRAAPAPALGVLHLGQDKRRVPASRDHGLQTEDPKFHTNVDIDRMVATYAHQIIEARGSIPAYGTVEVRGARMNVDAVAADHRSREIDAEAFWHWLRRRR